MLRLGVWLALQSGSLVVSPQGPFRTLSAAVAAARPGDTVRVRAGSYSEPAVIIDRPLTLLGDSGSVLDGRGRSGMLIVRADHVTISGLDFRDTGMIHSEDRSALLVEKAGHCRIERNRFARTFFAIYLSAATDCLVADNAIAGRGGSEAESGNGIHLWSSRDVRVSNNRISGHRDGIYLEFTRHAEVRGNLSERNVRYGMHFMYSDSSSYIGNTFRGNGSGVAVMYTKVVRMSRNLFTSSLGAASYGLLLKEIQDPSLDANVFSGNTVGLLADGADRLRAVGNRFEDNGWAIRLFASTVDGRFEANAFRRNSFDVAVNGTGTSTVFEGNWWEGYRGWDLDQDGFGDVPHRPMRLFALLVERTRPALLLQRSLFVRILDAAERALPVLTPSGVMDSHPLMRVPAGVSP